MAQSDDWQALRARLEDLKRRVTAEIQSYPPPIPACDAQFNHLLEQRRLLTEELRRLERAAGEGKVTVQAFLETSPCESLRL